MRMRKQRRYDRGTDVQTVALLAPHQARKRGASGKPIPAARVSGLNKQAERDSI